MDEDDTQLHDAAMAAVLTAAVLLTAVVALMAAALTGCAVAIEVDAHAPDRPAVTAPRPDGFITPDGDSKDA